MNIFITRQLIVISFHYFTLLNLYQVNLRKNFDFISLIIEESKCYTRRQKDNTFCNFDNMCDICMEIQSFLCTSCKTSFLSRC